MTLDADPSSSKKDKSSKIDQSLSFHNKTISQRSTILFAGPAANFIFLFWYSFLSIAILVFRQLNQ